MSYKPPGLTNYVLPMSFAYRPSSRVYPNLEVTPIQSTMPPEVNREPQNRIPPGMPVYDSDGQHTRLIVVAHPDASCDELDVPHTGKTVADYNPEYEPSAPVVQAVYQNQLDEKVEDWNGLHVEELLPACKDAGIQTYSYPAKRLNSSFSQIPERVETHRELLCYQFARMTHLAATINHPEQNQGGLMWSNYEKRVNGEVTMSSILKENQYQLKENLGICTYCNQEAETTFDHIVPVAAGGTDEISNMVPACQSCNSSKNDKNVIDWHQEHEIPVDRVVLGKYLKLRWEEFADEERLDDHIPETVHDRWEGVEIARRINKSIHMNSRA